KLPDEKLSKDATDALAVAWCHLMKQSSLQGNLSQSNSKTHQNNSKSSWESFVTNNPDRIRSYPNYQFMIAYLKGTIFSKAADQLILDVRDVGYQLEVSTQTLKQLPSKNEEVELLVYHHITDNDQRLFGFITRNEI